MEFGRYTYRKVLADSLVVRWEVEDLIGDGKWLDFTLPFLPEPLAGTAGIRCLSDAEKLKLNQIRGNSYLHLFAFVEEFILPFAMDQARRHAHDQDPYPVQALVNFANEEAKHRRLFRRFGEEFAKGFVVPCGVVGQAPEAAAAILRHGELGVALVVLHLEWMTQQHFLESVRDGAPVDPRFLDLLRHHWMEEAQHAKLDVLLIERLAARAGPAGIDAALDDYVAICGLFDGVLGHQVRLDLESLARATGRTFGEAEATEILEAQTRAYRWTFLGSGMCQPHFVRALGELSPEGQARVAGLARTFGAGS